MTVSPNALKIKALYFMARFGARIVKIKKRCLGNQQNFCRMLNVHRLTDEASSKYVRTKRLMGIRHGYLQMVREKAVKSH